MAKKEEMSTAAKAKAARAKASGTTEVKIYKSSTARDYFENRDRKVNRGVRVLAKAGKVISARDNAGAMGTKEVAKVKKVDADAYKVLSALAKGKALKGAEAEAAIQKAYKTVSSRMTSDRQRTASRGEAIVRREAKKRSGTNLG